MSVGKPLAGTWVCPVCGRRVPRREAECFCGAKQVQAEQHLKREEEKRSTRIPLDLAFLVVLLVLVAVYGIHRVTQEQEDSLPEGARNALAAVVATPEPPPALPSRPARVPQPAAPPPDEPHRAPQPPLPPPATPSLEPARVAIPTGAPTTTPAPIDERAQVRAAGLAAYEAELQRLASAASRLGQHVRAYARECGDAQKVAYAVSNCAEIESTVRREASQIQQGLDAADDQARRAWLEPGTVRDARSRSFFGSREWDMLESTARSLRR